MNINARTESDNQIIITHMNTPKTRRARRNPKQIPNKTAARDLKSLSDKTVEESFITAVKASFMPTPLKILMGLPNKKIRSTEVSEKHAIRRRSMKS